VSKIAARHDDIQAHFLLVQLFIGLLVHWWLTNERMNQ